ncbi:hypothetical protein BGX27_009379 [Mortierella sp. AM989]|nr:hypothetical protein BGX27_009379 [Mortierella sp. AM989]
MKNSTFPLRHNGITTRIHRVVIEEPLSAANVVEFLGMCPELRYLYWRSSKMIRFPLPQLASALMDGLWPRLTELDVDGNEMKDDDLAKALDGIGQLVSLRAPKAEFSSLSLQSIRKHISSIKTLDLRGCNYVTSSMIQSILCSMITLESLSVGRIGYMDIVTGSAWTSLNLRELAISIDMDTISSDKSKEKTLTRSDTSGSPSFEAHQRIVYGRLSSLERLSVLNLQPYPLNNYATMKRTLDLRLISGLEVLSSLKKLVDFSFKMTSQQMSMDEVQWITRNWTSLRKICGRFTSDPVQYYEMKRALNRYGILVYD